MSQYLGDISAYALAVSQGYTGTEEEFAELMASYATVGQTAVTAAQTATTKASEAATSATTATNKASEATTAATTATTKAGEASTSASTATSAKDTAVSASQTATTKATEATTAAATATSAKTDAVAANTAAQSAKTAAQTAQTGAETAAASVQSSAAQIATNTDELAQLKSEFTALESDGAVPSAEQIISDKGITDSVPYHYRKTGGDGADRLYDQIVGGTVCFNQLVRSARANTTVYGLTLERSADTLSLHISGTATNNGNVGTLSGVIPGTANHVYVCSIGTSGVTGAVVNGSPFNKTGAVGASAIIGKLSANDNIGININVTSGTAIDITLKPQLFDLTAMFGSTIADYIYSLETTHTGDGVAFFKSLFPNDYYPYNAGELISVSGLSAHVMRDADDNIIRSYPLDSTLTLRGIPKLVDGKMCFDGDVYDADGTVTRKYGVVDLGTLNWTKSTSFPNLFSCFKQLDMKIYNNTVVADWLSSNYKITSGNTLETTDKSIAMLNTNLIYVNDSSFTDATAEQFKTAMSGVMLVYPLVTPTTEEATPYQHLQQCDPNGTEEYVSTGIVPIGHNSFYPENLRAKVEQLPWNFASLIAPTESAFVATRNYTTGSLFIVSNVLYKATSNIANGGTITPNTNCTATTIAEIISALA